MDTKDMQVGNSYRLSEAGYSTSGGLNSKAQAESAINGFKLTKIYPDSLCSEVPTFVIEIDGPLSHLLLTNQDIEEI